MPLFEDWPLYRSLRERSLCSCSAVKSQQAQVIGQTIFVRGRIQGLRQKRFIRCKSLNEDAQRSLVDAYFISPMRCFKNDRIGLKLQADGLLLERTKSHRDRQSSITISAVALYTPLIPAFIPRLIYFGRCSLRSTDDCRRAWQTSDLPYHCDIQEWLYATTKAIRSIHCKQGTNFSIGINTKKYYVFDDVHRLTLYKTTVY